MITAAPVIRRPIDQMPAPGMTDFVSIFIAYELNADEYRTTFRHEQAHVWARHNMRRPKACDHAGEWISACEMEIARNIYDAEDIATITAPRSRLHGAFLPDTYPDLPADLRTAEEIYDWLVAHPPDKPLEQCTCHAEDAEECEQGEPQTLESIRAKLDEAEAAQKSEIAAASAYQSALTRPPSLIGEIDAALRVRFVPERSYRRPSRREVGGNVIERGRVVIPRPPLVEIFVDRSGSFSPDKTALAQQKLSSILDRYGASIKNDVFFFGSGKLTAEDNDAGGDTPYHLIAQHLLRSQPTLAIVITDDDPCCDLPSLPKSIRIICAPVGASQTHLAAKIHGKDVLQ
jgi:hypothetical protein